MKSFLWIAWFLLLLTPLQNVFADVTVVATVQDGSATWDADNNPGHDTDNSNGIVRTNDILNFCYEVAVNVVDESNVTLEIDLTPGLEFSLPPYCKTAGVTPLSGITGDYTTGETAVCNVGNLGKGTINLFCIPAKVHYTEDQGNTVGYTSSSISTDTAPTQTFGNQDFTVSAAPMPDISKQKGSYRIYRRPGPAGEPGIVLVYPLTVRMKNGGKGQEVVTSDLTITDNLGNVSPNARLYEGWAGAPATACIPNRQSGSGFDWLSNPYAYINTANGGPGGPGTSSGIPDRSVANSGSFTTCSSTGPGGVATMVINGANMDGQHAPIRNWNGGAVPADDIYLVSMVYRVWLPVQDILDNGGSLPTSNTYEMSCSTDSGATCVDPDPANNTRNATLNAGGGGCQTYMREYAYPGSPLLPGSVSSRDGNGLVSPGNKFKALNRIQNNGLDPEATLTNARSCITWDNSKHIITPGPTGNYADVRTAGGPPQYPIVLGAIEYGTGSSGPGTSCEDGASPTGWTTNPAAVPGGVSAITKVRVTQDLHAARTGGGSGPYVDLHVYHEYKLPQPPFGTIFADYGACDADEFTSERTSTYNENTPSGSLGDRATFTAVTVRVRKDEVNNTTSDLAGNDLDFQLQWSATFPATPANPTTYVEIEDTLPEWYTYISGSANITPGSVTYNPDGTTTLKWIFPAAVINQPQTPITYKVNISTSTPNNTDAVNTVVISSPDDGSPLDLRSDDWTVKVLNPALFAVNKTVIPQIVEKGGNITWRLSYTNLANNPIPDAQMIDILPNTNTVVSPASSYAGTIEFVSVSGSAGETFEYSADLQTTISNDPTDPANQAGGSTTWCANIGDPLPCPQVAADVTAIRITRSTSIPALGGPYYIDIVEKVIDFDPLDVYTNEFCLASSALAITICANPVQAKVGLADLSIEKEIIKEPSVIGDTVIYRLTVENAGPDAATGVKVTDNLPIGLSYVTSGGVGSYDSSTGIWDVGSVSPTPGSNSVTIDITAIADRGGCFDNYAEISESLILDNDSATETSFGDDDLGDGLPDDDETNVEFCIYPDVSLQKAASSVSSNPDGSFSLTYTLDSRNTGGAILFDHMITDDLATEYGTFTPTGTLSAGQYRVSAVTAAITADNAVAGDTIINANPSYNGDTDKNLLLLSTSQPSRLGPLDEVQVIFTVTFVPTAGKTTFLNQALATGESEEDGSTGGAGNSYDDLSDDPADGGTTDEDDPTEVEIPIMGEIGIAKSVATPITDNGDGTFTADFTLVTENSGNVPLYDVQISDDLKSVFGAFNSGTLGVGEYKISAGPSISAITAGSTLSLNPGYNGDSDINFLSLTSGDTLGVNGVVTILFSVTFVPDFNDNSITYVNQAKAEGDTTEDGTTDGEATDTSDDGSDPDPDGDGPGNDDDPTPVPIPRDPEIGLAKSVSNVLNNGDGTWSATYKFVVENTGNIPLYDVNLIDNLTTRFGAYESMVGNVDSPGEYGIASGPTITANSLNPVSANAGFTGASDDKLFDLSAGGYIMVGEKVELEFVITFYPDSSSTTFTNTATVTGDEEANGVPDGDASDDSQDGADPDPDNNDDPSDNDDPTEFEITLNPEVDLEKSASALIDNNDGTYSVTFTLKAENTGDATLFDVQVTDDISTGFGTYTASAPAAPGEYTITPLNAGSLVFTTDSPVTGDSLTVDTSFTGSGANTTLLTLTSGDSFGVGDIIEIPITITFKPLASLSYENQAVIEGDTSEDGTTDGDAEDESDDPTDNPGGDEDDPTPIKVPINPEIDTQKTASWTVPNGDGTYNSTFTIVTKNTGNVTLYDVQLSDDVAAGFGTYVSGVPSAPGEFTITPLLPSALFFSNDAAPTGDSLTLNTAFNGSSDTNLLVLSSGDSLGVNDEFTVQFVVTFYPDQSIDKPSYENQALAEGDTEEDGTTDGDVEDLSDDPTDNPGSDEDDPTPVFIPTNPDVGLVKSVSPVTDNGDGSFTATYTLLAANLGDVPLYDTQITDTVTTAFGTYVSGTPALPGEYTITPLVASDLVWSPNAPPVANTLTLDTSFNGTPANNKLLVLTPGDTLGVGDAVSISFEVTWIPDLNPVTAPSYENQAIVEGDEVEDGVTDGDVDDLSDDPADNPGNDEDDPTPVDTPINPEIDIEKALTNLVDNGDGTFNVTFELTTENTGNVTLYDTQIVDNLTTGFGTYVTGAPGNVGEYTITALTAADLTFVNDAAPIGNNLTVNTAFNGSSDQNMLALTSGDSLSVGDQVKIILNMVVYPNLNDPSLTKENQATAQGDTYEDGDTDGDAEDLSDDPADNPGGDEDDPTPVPFNENPEVRTTKELIGPVVDNADGTFTATFDIEVENTGNVPLYDFQITDDISAGFGTYQTTITAPGQYTLQPLVQTDLNFTNDAAPTGNSLTVDTGFTGSSGNVSILELTSGDSLGVADKAKVRIVVTYRPDWNNQTSWENQARAEGDTTEDGDTDGDAEDDSDDPSDNPGDDEDDPTPAPPKVDPKVSNTKSVGPVIVNGDGTFTTTFTIEVENTGNVPLYDFQIFDDMAAGFGTYDPAVATLGSYTIRPLVQSDLTWVTDSPLLGNSLTVNSSFTGNMPNHEMITLTSGDSLGVGDKISIPIEITFRPDQNGVLTKENQAIAEGDMTENGTTDGDAEDLSDDPADNPGSDEDDPTPVIIPIGPDVATFKEVTGGPTHIGGGIYEVEFKITATNGGNVPLYDYQMTDDLTPGFGAYVSGTPTAPGEYTVVPLTAADLVFTDDPIPSPNSLTINTAYNGSSDPSLIQLTPGDSLGVNDDVEITLKIHVFPSGSTSTLTGDNSVVTEGDVVEDGTTDGDVSDISDDPTDITDTDSDGDGDADDPTHVDFPEFGKLDLVKKVNRTSASVGDVVIWTVEVINNGTVVSPTTNVVDSLPLGFSYVVGTAMVNGANQEPSVSGLDLTWTVAPILPFQTTEITFATRITPLVSTGTNVNIVGADDGSEPVAANATAPIEIIPDHVFDCPDIIGKVFYDDNLDGYPNKGEKGVPGAKVYTLDGLKITTDFHGRFHVACPMIPNAARGSNFAIKLDVDSAPIGHYVTSENPRVKRLTRGKVIEYNFGIGRYKALEVILTDKNFEDCSTEMTETTKSYISALTTRLKLKRASVDVIYKSEYADKELVGVRTSNFLTEVQSRWNGVGRAYDLVIDSKSETTEDGKTCGGRGVASVEEDPCADYKVFESGNLKTVWFEHNQTNQSQEFNSTLEAIYSQIYEHKDRVKKIIITGHTSTVGKDSYNQQLSNRRAEVVARNLGLRKDIWNGLVSIRGAGEKEILVDEKSDKDEALNRRTEIFVELDSNVPLECRSFDPRSFTVYFGINKSNIDDEDKKIIGRAIREYQKGYRKIVLRSYADSVRDSAYNKALALKRLEAVRARLIKRLPGDVELKTEVLGEEDAPIETEDNTHEERNRIVSIIVY